MTADRRRGARPAAFLATVGMLLAFALLLVPATPASGAPGSDADADYASIALTDITPSTVTAGSGRTVTVRGSITNTFDRPIHDVSVRLQRANAVTSTHLRTVLDAASSYYSTVTDSTTVSADLEPGRTAQFTATVPLSDGGLQIGRAGVYPLLVNATGTPDNGGLAQIADSRTLLPVLSLPPNRARAQRWVAPGSGDQADPLLGRDGSVAANESSPSSFTFLWPLAAPPQQAAGTLGGHTADMRLISDAMTQSLAPDGRLGQSLSALETLAGTNPDGQGTAPPTAPDERVRPAFCVAVDPDLLVTVQGMASGYDITDDPADPNAPTRDGDGSSTAKSWLQRLTAVAHSLCVTALPYAQAGLDSLQAVGDDALADEALDGGYDIVDAILGVTSVRGLTTPAVGTVTDRGRTLLAGRSAAAVVSTSVEPDSGTRSGSSLAGRYRSGALAVQTYDAGVSAALGAVGDHPTVPSYIPAWQRAQTAHESALSRRQTAAASLAYPMLDAPPASDDDADVTAITGRSAFTMPPVYWSPTPADARALLDTAGLMVTAGTARAVPLSEVVTGLARVNRNADLTVPGDVPELQAGGYPLSTSDQEDVRRDLALIDQLRDAFVSGHDHAFTPDEYLRPLRHDLLRTMSTPATPDTDAYRGQRPDRLTAVSATLAKILQSVSLLDPSGRYTLASERSPLLLVVRNELALPVKVRLDITAPDEISVGDVGVVEIPAQGTRQLQLPTHASSSQPATVRIALVTSNDIPLSSPVDLSIYANAYGQALFYITIGAGVILVLLTARRLWHRFRGEPDRADEDRPEPDEHERELASTGYQQRLAAERVTEGADSERTRDAPDPPGDRPARNHLRPDPRDNPDPENVHDD